MKTIHNHLSFHLICWFCSHSSSSTSSTLYYHHPPSHTTTNDGTTDDDGISTTAPPAAVHLYVWQSFASASPCDMSSLLPCQFKQTDHDTIPLPLTVQLLLHQDITPSSNNNNNSSDHYSNAFHPFYHYNQPTKPPTSHTRCLCHLLMSVSCWLMDGLRNESQLGQIICS